MIVSEPIGFPPFAETLAGVDRLGAGCRIGATVTVFREVNAHSNAGIFIGDGVVLFDYVRLLLGAADTRLEIGNRVVINVGAYVSGEGGLYLSDHVMVGPHARFLSAGHGIHGEDAVIARNSITGNPIRVGRGAWIGAAATLLDGVRIGEGAVVGAASVVTRDIPDFAVAVGNPARVVHYRQGHGPVSWWRRWLHSMRQSSP